VGADGGKSRRQSDAVAVGRKKHWGALGESKGVGTGACTNSCMCTCVCFRVRERVCVRDPMAGCLFRKDGLLCTWLHMRVQWRW